MRRIFHTGTLLLLPALLLATATAVPAADPEAEPGLLLGSVSSGATPLATAVVFAYQLADEELRQAVTDGQGNFLFDALPAGLYKVVAYKQGFLPAVVMLSRASVSARQFLQVELTAEPPVDEVSGDDFWSIRERIPGDVLRRIELASSDGAGAPSPQQRAAFEAEMQALTGIRQTTAAGQSQLTGGRLDLSGHLLGLQVGVSGNFVELAANRFAQDRPVATAEAQALTVNLASSDGTEVSVSSMRNSMLNPSHRPILRDVDLEQYRVSWSQVYGGQARSQVAARYVEESNYFRTGLLRPREVPASSRLLHLEGSYETALTDRTTVNAGLRYRSRQADTVGSFSTLAEQRVDLSGGSGVRLRPTMLVEYGLYSTLQDGSLSFAPRGELVVELGRRWTATTAASHRVRDTADPAVEDFFVTYYRELESCEQLDDYCYQVFFTRSLGEDEELTVGATHRRLGETLRMYFSHDFFDQFESLYLVRGDQLPKLDFALSRRLAPQIVTRIETSLAAGGGGLLTGRNDRAFENSVQYLVTSMDTRFESTSTGLAIAFHRLEQELEPLDSRRGGAELERERLQVRISQDFDFLRQVASNLAVQLNMEVSRGTNPDDASHDPDELLKRFMGGIALKF